jgi:pimeloyl-ACP methyl ester carboxylesterase
MEVRAVRLADGIVISCHLSGEPGSPPMVLLHALGEEAAGWDDVAARFATRFRVVALDLRGHGASSWPGVYSFPVMRDDVLGVLDSLDLHNVVLVGHSMGGTVAYLVAQARPGRISRLVVEDVPPPFPRERAIPARPAGELPFDWDVVPAIIGEVNDPSMRWWKHLPEITAPTLLVGGGTTSHIPQDLLVDVSKAVPDCSLITIPVGHNVHESEPEAFAQTVLNWLATRRNL